MRKSDVTIPKKREILAREDRIQVILEASQRVFSSRAYDAISIDDIAAEASMSKGLLYHYFTNKRDLYLDTLRSVFVTVSEIPKNCPDQRNCIAAFLSHFEQHPALTKMIFRGGIGSDAEVEALLDEYHQSQFEVFLQAVSGSTITPFMKLGLRGWISFFQEVCLQWIEHNEDIRREQVLDLLEQNLQAVISSTMQ